MCFTAFVIPLITEEYYIPQHYPFLPNILNQPTFPPKIFTKYIVLGGERCAIAGGEKF